MKNSIFKQMYHFYICKKYKNLSFRGGWMLTHLFYLDYKKNSFLKFYDIISAHLKGWSYSDWSIIGVTNSTHQEYLSTRDYCLLHPLNKEYSFWIDDKLTLKYILHGTEAGEFMPDYYFHIRKNGVIHPLMNLDQTKYKANTESVIELLKEKKVLAFKLVKASLGEGFYKAEYKENKYFLNNSSYSYEEFIYKVNNLSNYVITEFLFPHPEFAKYCAKSVGCLRYIIGRLENGKLEMIYSFMRFGTSKSGFVENYNSGGVLAIINKDGTYTNGNVLDFKKLANRVVTHHPDNGIQLTGKIPNWHSVQNAANQIANAMPQLSYMGIDFCITNENKIKIIEINSLSSLDAFQLDKSIFKTQGGKFFIEKLKSIKKKI